MPFAQCFKRCLLFAALCVFFFLMGGNAHWRTAVPAQAQEISTISEIKAVPFIVAKGEGMAEIAKRLGEKGLIKSAFGFKIYALVTGTASRFKPGAYLIPVTARGKDIANLFVAGIPRATVTIPEGATVVDIDRIFAKAGVTKAGELIEYNGKQKQTLEGFLFPDTYTFSGGTPIADVVATMRANFEKKISPLTAHMKESERYALVIFASLIEKEARYAKDRAAVASVIHERLTLGMPLQIDAANVYVKCKGAYLTCPSADRMLTKADLTLDGPYNTYTRAGLPTAPIANAGLDAFRAALAPKGTVNLYYISNPATGRLIFAETLEEHNENRQKYH